MRRALVLLVLLACKDKTVPEAPKPGSASAVPAPAPPASTLAHPLPKRAGTPPVRAAPLDAAAAARLARLDAPGWTRDVRLADAKGVELRYRTAARPTLVVTVQASRCFDCLPMDETRWRAKSDALRALVAPELRDRADTTWEIGITDLAGAPAVWTYHAAHALDPSTGTAYGTAYTLYFNDGVNMIRVVAEYADDAPASRDALQRLAPKQDLAQIATAFADAVVHAW